MKVMESNQKECSDMMYVPIMPKEENYLKMGFPPIVTVTWFEGDRTKAHHQIQTRMKEVIRSNPWLRGQFIKHAGKMCIAYPSDAEESTESPNGSMLVHLHEPDPVAKYGAPQIDPTKTKEKLILEHKKDKKQPLWKVVILPCAESPSDRFGVFISMSHILGDGQNFYQLYNMLLCGEPVRSLIIDRVPGSLEQCIDAMGREGSCGLGSPKMLANFLYGLVARTLSRKTPTLRTFLVDMEKLDEMKEAQKEDCPFVSSNDILTSWFSSQTNAMYSHVAVNMRKHLAGHAEDNVGNYVCGLFLDPSGYASPSAVRKNVDKMQNPHVPWRVARGRIALVTNWSALPSERTALVGCDELLHMPILDKSADAGSNFTLLVVFRARPGQLGCLAAGTTKRVENVAPFESEESSL